MQFLPAIRSGDAQWRLPLSDATAVRLANAVLAEGEDARRQSIADTLAADPALTLWFVATAWTRAGEQPRTFSQLASWMTLEQWRVVSDEGAAATDTAGRARWSELMHASLRLSDDNIEAMLHNAREWLAATGGDIAHDQLRLNEVLPPWLVDEQVEPRDQGDDARARELVDQWNATIPCAGELLAKAVRTAFARAERQRGDDEHRLREKLASLKEFTYGASHELNNPLFNISSRAQVLLRDEQNPERRKKLATIYSHAMRASEMINDIALAARPATPQFERVDVMEVARTVIDELGPQAALHRVTLSFDSTSDGNGSLSRTGLETCSTTTLEADATQLAVVIREICLNAIEGIGRADRGGNVRIQLIPQANTLEIAVQDDGPGLDERSAPPSV